MRPSRALASFLSTSSICSCTAFTSRTSGFFAFTAAAIPPTTRAASTTTTSAAETCAASLKEASDYQELARILHDIQQLSRAASVLSYDQMVFMPESASAERGKQSAALAAVIHEKSISPRIGELLAAIENNNKNLQDSSSDAMRVAEMARQAYDKKVKIPTTLASQQASLSAEAYTTWTKAREAHDFGMFKDILGQAINVSKQVASLVQTEQDKANGKPLYATLLDEYEVGMDADRIDAIFAQIQKALVPLIQRVFSDKATPPNTSLLHGEFNIPDQEALSKQLVQVIGFDNTRGRIDVSVHPFSSSLGGKYDVRITSRFRTDEWYQGLAGSLHEAGHAMYEQNVKDSGYPLIDNALSMGMHESQSLFWERHVGLSKAFWEYAAPIANRHLNGAKGATAEEYYAAVNAANPSLIRVEADELTYALHVILRYTIEREFIEGRLDVQDIPQKWNEGMKTMLNVDVPNDAKGCLQDVHWSMMAFGYFPTYLIGAATAAQLAHYCQQDIADFEAKVKAGEFDEIRAWMTEKIHQHGSRYKSLDQHLEAQLGESLNPKYFIEYLTSKYTDLYKC